MKKKSTAIICAYNEENTIVNIIKDVFGLQFFNEVIVINDGSKDNTGLLIKQLKKSIDFKDVHLNVNKGKGFAMARGAELASNEYLVFIDADLSNFTITHARKLLYPVLSNKADMVLGQPTKTLIRPEINPFKNLSGQRSIRKIDLLPILESMKPSRFGVETLINIHYKSTNKKVEYVQLTSLIHPTKFHKTKPHKAIKEFIIEGYQILVTIFSNRKAKAKLNKHRFLTIISTNY